ncbi:MAG: glycerol-3-phosphate 1-O-acyltransferase PlsY [Xanthomonadales bacterium]|nr:glycerol-3-phosphate 1-O-acyltransferase PlsY [Xanthomonadales bacterium]
MIEPLLAAALGYLLGSVSGAVLLGRLHGLDPRQHGSGNAGGTNVLRLLGPQVAAAVVAIDLGKGLLAAALGGQLWPEPAGAGAALAGFAAVVGHCYPLWHGFRGGKGVATTAGASLIVLPWQVPPLALVWLLTLLASGIASLASILAALALALLALWPFGELPARLFAVAAGAWVLLMHQANIERLRQGREPRLERLRLLRRRPPR